MEDILKSFPTAINSVFPNAELQLGKVRECMTASI